MSRPIKSGNWKGDKAGYWSKHERIYVRFGKPKKCDDCGTTIAKKYEWANISKKYKTLRSDWKRLCVSCHRKFDGHTLKVWKIRKARGDNQWTKYKRNEKGQYVS